MSAMTLLIGGARSGKSSLAVDIGNRHDAAGIAVTYIATASIVDDEMAERVARHRAERPAGWATIEEERHLAAAIALVGAGTLIIDCLTTWVSNLQFTGVDQHDVLRHSEAAVDAARRRRGRTIVISNEVGLGIVPIDAGVREYRDLLGRVNQQWVSVADHALLLVAGRALPLRRPEELL